MHTLCSFATMHITYPYPLKQNTHAQRRNKYLPANLLLLLFLIVFWWWLFFWRRFLLWRRFFWRWRFLIRNMKEMLRTSTAKLQTIHTGYIDRKYTLTIYILAIIQERTHHSQNWTLIMYDLSRGLCNQYRKGPDMNQHCYTIKSLI